MKADKRKRARRKVAPVVRLRIRVALPRGSGPWLYVNGEYAAGEFGQPQRAAEALGFPRWGQWPAGCADWYESLCYWFRGRYGAREITVPNAQGHFRDRSEAEGT